MSPAQARAALAKHKDVMEAAERIFSGEFEDVMDIGEDDSQERPYSPQRSSPTSQRDVRPRMIVRYTRTSLRNRTSPRNL